MKTPARIAITLLLSALVTPALAQDKPAVQDKVPTPDKPTAPMAVGVNTAVSPSIYVTSASLADGFKHSDGWRQPGNAAPAWPLDAKGGLLLPAGQQAIAHALAGFDRYPLGDWVAEYEGDGDFEVWTDNLNAANVKAPKGTFPVTITKQWVGGIVIVCNRSNPADPVRNFKLWRPGYYQSGKTFTDEYLKGLAGYQCLRTMDDTATNGSTQAKWSDRPKLTDVCWTNAGIPIEALVDLCNLVGADLWYCLPHRADDDYATQAAKLIHGRLKPGLKVYVEISNEVWNWGFAQAQWAKDQYAPGTNGETPDSNFFGQTNWLPYRSRQVFTIWEAEWKADRDRLVTVIASQTWADRGRFLLRAASKFNGGGKPCDALAIAPYLTSPIEDDNGAIAGPLPPIDGFLGQLEARVASQVANDVRENKKAADEFGVRLLGYEGGQHLVGNGKAKEVQDLYFAANRHPRMESVYLKYLQTCSREGMTEINLYAEQGPSTIYGSWGLKEAFDTPLADAPKLRGVLAYLAASAQPEPAPDPDPLPPVVEPTIPPVTTADLAARLDALTGLVKGLVRPADDARVKRIAALAPPAGLSPAERMRFAQDALCGLALELGMDAATIGAALGIGADEVRAGAARAGKRIEATSMGDQSRAKAPRRARAA